MQRLEYPAIWLQAATCTGCSVSVLNSVAPGIRNILLDELVPGKHVNLRFQATVMAGQGEAALEVLTETRREKSGRYLLIVEGSIQTANAGLHCLLGEQEGRAITLLEQVKSLGRDALAVLALGTCAAYGGIPSGQPNPTGAKGVGEVLRAESIETPVVNIPGCPPHPDWFVGTAAGVLLFGLPRPDELDEVGRPKAFYGKLVHDNCSRRAFFETGKFAKSFGEPGCLYELGCKGYVTYADCPIRHWNQGTSWCIDAGGVCMGCVEPEFPDVLAPIYRKMVEGRIPALRFGAETGRLAVGTWP